MHNKKYSDGATATTRTSAPSITSFEAGLLEENKLLKVETHTLRCN